ncbi:hypothetical protein [Fretibacter rubidus]|uniref:hypothetical protein n=1 Tax=Fretibacter rubidus TaxID=570162 RepID=UPI00352B5AF4
MTKYLIAAAVMTAFAMPATAQDTPKPVKPKTEAQTFSNAKPKAKPKAPLDIEAFFKEGEAQARDMPEGCKPKVEPELSKPVA